MKRSSKQTTLNLAQLAILIALIFVMQYIGTLASSPFKAMGIELSFVLLPIVIGAFLLGPFEGGVLGFVFGVMTVVLTILAPGSMTYILFESNPIMYIVVAMTKAVAAGIGSALIYMVLDKLFKGRLVYLRTTIAAASAPIINTGIFLLGMELFFNDVISEKWAGDQSIIIFLVGLIWINFVIEFAINIVLTPSIIRIVEVVKKKIK